MTVLMHEPDSPRPASPAAPPRVRALAGYALTGDLRFLSHHDEMRMLARALRRADWPLRFSAGFNPMPQFTLPLPRPVGTASTAQIALIELDGPHDPRPLYERLAAAMPPPATLHQVVAPFPLRGLQPQAACYEVDLDPADAEAVAPRIGPLLAQREVTVPRQRGREAHAGTIDIRYHLRALEAFERTLRMTITYDQQRTARPTEVLFALGLAAEAYAHRVLRTRVIWDTNWASAPAWPANSGD